MVLTVCAAQRLNVTWNCYVTHPLKRCVDDWFCASKSSVPKVSSCWWEIPRQIISRLSLPLLHTFLSVFVATPMFVQASLVFSPDTIRQSYENESGWSSNRSIAARKNQRDLGVFHIPREWFLVELYLPLPCTLEGPPIHDWLAGNSIHLWRRAYGGFSKEVESTSSPIDGRTIIKVSRNPSKRTLQAMKLVPWSWVPTP